MTTLAIHHNEGQSIDRVVDYILDNHPDLPDRLSKFKISTSGGVVAGGRGSTSLKIIIEYYQEKIDADTLREIEKLLDYLQTLSADGIVIEQEK